MKSNGMDAKGSLVACALVMELAYLSLHLARNPAEQIAAVLAAYGVAGLAFAWLLWRCHRGAWASPSYATWAIVLLGGVAFRLTLMPLNPATSPDVHRYLWEGIVQTYGFNPYVHAPAAPELASIARAHALLHAGVVHAGVPAIYAPFAQLLFRLNATLFGATRLGWKVILLLFDLILVLSLYAVLRQRSAPLIGIALVLWCPLLILETYEGAHLDLVGAALLALAVATMLRGHWALSGVALGLSIQVKYLWPLLALIVLVPCAPRRRAGAYVAVVGMVGAACWLPYASGLGAAMTTAKHFVSDWGFNDPVFSLLRSIPGPHWVPMTLVAAWLSGLAVRLARRRPRTPWSDTWLLGGTALLLGPVAYPWYFLWVLPGLALRPAGWLIAWVLTVPILHVVGWRHVVTGAWDPMPWLCALVAVAPFVGLVVAWRRRLSNVDPQETRRGQPAVADDALGLPLRRESRRQWYGFGKRRQCTEG